MRFARYYWLPAWLLFKEPQVSVNPGNKTQRHVNWSFTLNMHQKHYDNKMT